MGVLFKDPSVVASDFFDVERKEKWKLVLEKVV